MPLKVLVVVMVLVSLVAFGQTGAGNYPVPQPVVIMPPVPNTVLIGNGLGETAGTVGYYGEGPAGGVLLTTPTATFDAVQPTAGISDAGRAGISNSNPVNFAVQSSLYNSTVVYSNVGVYGSNVETEAPEVPAASPATSAVSPDYGPSFYSNKITVDEGGGASLGEIAARYRALDGTHTVRTYTNADIRPPETIESALAAHRRPDPPDPPQTGSSTGQVASALPRTSSTAWQPTEESADTTAAQPLPAELPASSSMLPLLGLLGFASVGIGFLLKARRVELRD